MKPGGMEGEKEGERFGFTHGMALFMAAAFAFFPIRGFLAALVFSFSFFFGGLGGVSGGAGTGLVPESPPDKNSSPFVNWNEFVLIVENGTLDIIGMPMSFVASSLRS